MLPQVLPMLAVPATPFDSPEYSFEIKWNGIRALAAVGAGGCGAGSGPTTRPATQIWTSSAVCQPGHWWTVSWWRLTPTAGPICRGCCAGMV